MPKRVLTSIRLDKIAAVDLPCQEHATVAIIKRAPPAPAGSGTIIKATFAQALTGCLLADQVREAFYTAFDNMYEGKDAFRTALIDELAAGGDGSAASDAYKAWLTTLVDRAVVSAKAAGAATVNPADLNKAFTTAAAEWLAHQETTMPITTKAQLQTAIAKFRTDGGKPADIAAIKAAAKSLNVADLLPAELADAPSDENAVLKRRVAVLELPADLRKHFDGLPEAGQTAFLAKDAAGQRAEFEAANADDPVVHTMADGTEVRKSAGAFAIMMAKRFDAQAATIATLEKKAAGSSIEKRAAAYPNIAKGVAASLLKAHDAAPEAERPAMLAAIVAMNKAQGGAFNTVGSTGGGEDQSGDIAKAKSTFEGKVNEIAKARSIGKAEAMSIARVEHADLFLAAHPDEAEDEAA